MATTSIVRPHSFDRQQSLLKLDCSADLRSYSRNLGPGVQEKLFQRTSEALRAQLDEHREFLLGHQRNGQRQISPVPQVNVGPWPHTLPPDEPAHQPYPYAPTPPYAQTQDPIPGDVNTYPPALRDALDRCMAFQQPNDDTIYHVIEDIQSTYMDNAHKITGTYQSLQGANEEVVRKFLFDGAWSSGIHMGYDPEYMVLEGGGLKCAIQTDGSMGGYTQIYVHHVNLSEMKRRR
ncbi:uncharacterized protein K460DRAFT_355563 [Cucurbitaria berberidis CBS 394.84]|uniref:Uncharacterized protein n=1 Tax=Cucurbitaria berberidis CBS 394.84 TaxID=1168544 RepID=A0A9P4GIE7_9PLEO|nr:uncharacterized protein K460DRAFT_355563 [Cucurbitaria berberidis CBS 394.84]KAF1845799.1 hypothetical protein K460DRAFT_355563 [Cucurbitaria berberidis CBS 394.84]